MKICLMLIVGLFLMGCSPNRTIVKADFEGAFDFECISAGKSYSYFSNNGDKYPEAQREMISDCLGKDHPKLEGIIREEKENRGWDTVIMIIPSE